jgi:hypothetical protein
MALVMVAAQGVGAAAARLTVRDMAAAVHLLAGMLRVTGVDRATLGCPRLLFHPNRWGEGGGLGQYLGNHLF